MRKLCIMWFICISCTPLGDRNYFDNQSNDLDSASVEEFDKNTFPSLLSINELLFDPLGDGADYVEIVNVSRETIDLSAFSLANRNAAGVLGTGKRLSTGVCCLKPGGYCLLSGDTARVAADYGCPSDSLRLQIKGFPSYPNESGCVVLTDQAGRIVDEFPYDKYLHHPLVAVREGIALEKLHPLLSSADPASWTSAAADGGFGSPGRQNTQYRPWHLLPEASENRFHASSEVFYPRRLGTDSQWRLHYRFTVGCVANVTVYDQVSVPCCTLADNLLLGGEGLVCWSGLDDEGRAVPFGRYLVRAQCHTAEGQVFRQFFVVAVQP